MNTQVGTIIGNAKLERVLGRGFLGESFVARRASDNRQVVVKILHDHFTGDASFRDRFSQLVRNAAVIRHPNIVPIEDYGESNGRFYITLGYYPDGSLRGLLQRFQAELPLPRAVALMRQAADGIAAAHASGLFHRDLKPENILLAKRDQQSGFGNAIAQVADFGLTQLAELGATIGGNMAFGSFPYLSPEHCKGTGLDARSDVYSLGVVLYESITGGPPFQVKTLADALKKHLSTAPPKPRAVVPSLPVELEQIVLRCLEKEPASRYQSAQAVSAALADLRMGGEIVVNLGSQRPQAPPPSAGRPNIVVNLRPEGQPPAPQPPPIVEAPPSSSPGRWEVRLDPGAPVAPPQAPAPQPASIWVNPPPPSPPPYNPPPIAPSPGPGQGWQVNLDDQRPMPVVPGHVEGVHRASPQVPGPGLGDSVVARGPAPPRRDREQPAKPRPRGRTSKLVNVVVEPPTLTLIPGQPGLLRVTVVNTSRRVEHFSLRVDLVHGPGGAAERWVTNLPRKSEALQLLPDGRATIPLSITVPMAPENAAGEYQVDISAIAEVSGEVGTTTVTWVVQPFFETSVVVTPARATGWRGANFSIALTNLGTSLVRYVLSATDDDRALRYQFSQAEVSLDHGVGAAIDLKVRGRLRPIGGIENRTCNIRVDRIEHGGPQAALPEFKTARAQFVHRALVPTWLLPVLIALAIGVYMAWPRTKLAIEVSPPTVAATIDIRTKVAGTIKNQKGERVPTRTVSWAIQDTTIARLISVEGDTVTILPRRVGNTTLIASAAKMAAAHVQLAVAAPSVEKVTLIPGTLSLAIGESRTLNPVIADIGGQRMDRPVTWFSSDPTVATVGNGEVTAKAPGRAVVTAQVEAKTATATVVVRPDSVGTIGTGTGTGPGPAPEDCLSYEPSLLLLKNEKQRGWTVQHQGQALLRFDKKGEAEQGLNLARRYKQHCYIGRRNTRTDSTAYYIEYWKGPSDVKTEIKKEQCQPYNRDQLEVVEGSGDWEVRAGGAFLVRAASKADADRAKAIAENHFAFCQIGQKNTRANHRLYMIQYWR